MRRLMTALGGGVTLAATVSAQTLPPIIDVHLHAMPAGAFGSTEVPACIGKLTYSPRDPHQPYGFDRFADCAAALKSPRTDEGLFSETLAQLRAHNITAIVSGPIDLVRAWKRRAEHRFIPGIEPAPLDSIRQWAQDGTVRVLGEFAFQYAGQSPADSVPESYFALAEQLDLPVGLHVGLGPPGAAYVGTPNYRMALSNPLLLEPVLLRHPKLRLYVMHAGWPMLDEMLGLLYAHPQVYVDTGVIDWFLPRAEFYTYLKRLVDAGFGKRIMFGSDQMIWPGAIPVAVDAIQSAPFLTSEQKRDILYNNAVRFFRLDREQRTRPSSEP